MAVQPTTPIIRPTGRGVAKPMNSQIPNPTQNVPNPRAGAAPMNIPQSNTNPVNNQNPPVIDPNMTNQPAPGKRRWWFWALIGLLVLLVLSAIGVGIYLLFR